MVASLKLEVLRSLGWSAIDRWGNRIVSVVVLVVLARLLDPKSFGILAAASIFIEYLELFVSQGIGFAIIQRRNLEPQHLNAAFWVNTTGGALLSIVLWLSSRVIADLFSMPELTPVLRSLSPLLFVTGISRIQAAMLTRELRFKELAIRKLCSQLSGGLVGVLLAIYGFGVWSLVWQTTTSAVVGTLVLWFACKWWPGISMSITHIKDMYGFSVKIFIDQQVIFFSSRIDEGLIGYLLDSATLGFYSIGKRLVLILFDLFNSTVGIVIFPVFSKMQQDRQRLINWVLLGSRLYLAAAIPVYFGLAAVASEAISFVFGNRWSPAAGVTMLLAISGPFQFAPVFIHAAFQATGGPGIPLALNAMRGALSLILFPLGSFYGAIGIAGAFMLRGILAPVADIIVLKIKMGVKIKPFFEQARMPILSAAIAVVLSKVVMNSTVLTFGLQASFVMAMCVGATTYTAVLWTLSRSFFRDVRNIFQE